jgi:hypothetical protein
MCQSKHDIVRSHCNECSHETKHALVASRQHTGSEPIEVGPDRYEEINWSTTYDLLECCGCEAVSVRRTFWFSETEGNQVTFFPPRLFRRRPEWFDDLDESVQALLSEIYVALQNDSRRLAMMGARAAIDVFMLQKIGDAGSFVQKLKALQEGGYVSTRQKAILGAALDMGSAAAHRGHLATVDELNQVIDIIENLFQMDLLDAQAGLLRESVPPRPRPQRTDRSSSQGTREEEP